MNKILFKDKHGKEMELLAFDKTSNYSLLDISNGNHKQFVIASNLDMTKGEWDNGTYFFELIKAKEEYLNRINEFDKDRYRHTFEYLLRTELECRDIFCEEKMITKLYDMYLDNDSYTTMLNPNIVEHAEDYLDMEIENEEIER